MKNEIEEALAHVVNTQDKQAMKIKELEELINRLHTMNEIILRFLAKENIDAQQTSNR